VRLRELTIPEPYDLDSFVARLAERRQRPLHISAFPYDARPDSPCGLWLATEHQAWVFVEHGTTPLHRSHIVLHELAHMIFGHTDQDPSFRALLPHLDGERVRQALARTSYTTQQEREAELLASLIRARAGIRAPAPPAAHHAPQVAAVLDRAARTLGRPR